MNKVVAGCYFKHIIFLLQSFAIKQSLWLSRLREVSRAEIKMFGILLRKVSIRVVATESNLGNSFPSIGNSQLRMSQIRLSLLDTYFLLTYYINVIIKTTIKYIIELSCFKQNILCKTPIDLLIFYLNNIKIATCIMSLFFFKITRVARSLRGDLCVITNRSRLRHGRLQISSHFKEDLILL